jgi:hypothetical protein
MDLPIESLRFRYVSDEKYLQNSSGKNMEARLGPSVTRDCGTKGAERDIEICALETWRAEGSPMSNSDI